MEQAELVLEMGLEGEVSKKKSVLLYRQATSKVIHLKQLGDGIQILSLRIDISPAERGKSLLKLEWPAIAAACQSPWKFCRMQAGLPLQRKLAPRVDSRVEVWSL